jgi:hypothetical protein
MGTSKKPNAPRFPGDRPDLKMADRMVLAIEYGQKIGKITKKDGAATRDFLQTIFTKEEVEQQGAA